MDLTIAIASYGDEAWRDLALSRAYPSAAAECQSVVVYHGQGTLAQARNAALEQVEAEWVVFLDADDELEPGYVAALAGSRADLRAPSVRYVRAGSARRPWMPRVAGHNHACTAECLRHGNWLIVGTAVRASLVREVGGWHEYDWSEDWDLWLRCWFAGASVEAVPSAIYRAHVREDSRNRGVPRAFRNAVHRQIARANSL